MAENLDDLLEDALADFENNEDATSNFPSETEKTDKSENVENERNVTNRASPEDVFKQMFDPSVAENLQKEWNSAMDELKTEDPELAEQLKHTIFNQTDRNQTHETTPSNLNDTLTATIAEMSQSAEGAKNMDMTPDELFSQMQGLNLGGDGMEDNFFSMMENMMKSLLAKEVLYPSMKELSSSYDPWLEKNKCKLSTIDYNRYTKQNDVIKHICKEYCEETNSDSEEVKSTRFKVIMGLVQQMQQHGDPPEDLMKECADSESIQNVFGGPNPFPDMTDKPEDLLKGKEDCTIM